VGDQCNQGVGTEFGGARRFIDAGGTVPGNSLYHLVGAGELSPLVPAMLAVPVRV